MQATSIINDDFTATQQSDEFASEYEAWLDEQEKNYWREIEAKGSGHELPRNEQAVWAIWWGYKIA